MLNPTPALVLRLPHAVRERLAAAACACRSRSCNETGPALRARRSARAADLSPSRAGGGRVARKRSFAPGDAGRDHGRSRGTSFDVAVSHRGSRSDACVPIVFGLSTAMRWSRSARRFRGGSVAWHDVRGLSPSTRSAGADPAGVLRPWRRRAYGDGRAVASDSSIRGTSSVVVSCWTAACDRVSRSPLPRHRLDGEQTARACTGSGRSR